MLSSLAVVKIVPYVGLGRRSANKAAVLHTNDGNTSDGSLFSVFSGNASGAHGPDKLQLGAHFQVKNDGTIEQYIDCAAPHHRTLTSSLRWVPLGDVRVGDELIAFDDQGPRRAYRRAVVVHAQTAKRSAYEVELATGQVFTVTGNHPWLVRRGAGDDGSYTWRKTQELVGLSMPYINSVNGRPRTRHRSSQRRWSHKAPLLLEPWEDATDYDAGWLAGLFDREGSLSARHALSLSQRPGPIMERAVDLLRARGKTVTVTTVDSGKNDCQVAYVTGRLRERLSLLGSIRPDRLLSKVNADAFGQLSPAETHSILRVRPVGDRDVVLLVTSTGTVVVEGYPMHNTDLSIGHAFAANAFAIGIETEDNGNCMRSWTDAQVNAIAALLFELGVPPQLLEETASDGVGWHRQFDSWNQSGHTCPCDTRQRQITEEVLPGLEEEMSKSNEYFEQLERDGVDPGQYSAVVRFEWGYQRGIRKRPLAPTDAQDPLKKAGFERGAKEAAALRTPGPRVPTPSPRGVKPKPGSSGTRRTKK